MTTRLIPLLAAALFCAAAFAAGSAVSAETKFQKIPASHALKRKAGQVLVCYDGSHNAQVCYWAYSPR